MYIKYKMKLELVQTLAQVDEDRIDDLLFLSLLWTNQK